jgi:hypothetical protein
MMRCSDTKFCRVFFILTNLFSLKATLEAQMNCYVRLLKPMENLDET